MNDKVSIIMPSYNSHLFIGAAIESVIKQSYTNWELLIVDDCSTDNSVELIERYIEKDHRIKLYKQQQNQRVANARNRAIKASTGRYIMYLDSDDIWSTKKIELQMEYMKKQKIAFSCTDYEVIDQFGNPKGKVVKMMDKVDYKGFLMNNLIQIVGVAIDTAIVDRELLLEDPKAVREDAASWLKILKAGYECYGLNKVLAQYRRVGKSASSNKVSASIGMWKLYKEEELSLFFSMVCFVRYTLYAVWKRVYIAKKISKMEI